MTKIDLVYLWCDSTDEEWSAKRKRFQQYDCIEKTAAADCRFINNNELLFSMRSVAKFVPWVNHIYLITDHQIPSWLNVEHPKITLVNHEDILPREVLPTFNSMAIETGDCQNIFCWPMMILFSDVKLIRISFFLKIFRFLV